ncbi:MAG: NifB/NifX family molybdenum-iron cluster-binding protein, partial [Halodesulfurarchaeum sp.]
MRIALPTDEDGGTGTLVSGHFGRTGGFTIVDTETDEAEFVSHAGGHGPNASPPPVTVTEAGADAVIAGDIGRGAVSRLREADITVYRGAKGTVAEALERWRAGELTEVGPEDVHGHDHDHEHGHGHGDGHGHDHEH